jgi:hypothetical protein
VNKSHFQSPVVTMVLAAGLLLGAAMPARAQVARVGATQFPQPTDGVRRFPAVAYDSVNNAYLVTWGLTTVGARFVSADGAPLSTRQTVSTAAGGATRVACGGGVCLIAWVQEPTSIMGRLVRYQSGAVQMVTAPFFISANGRPKLSSAAPAVAYGSEGAGEFLVAWTEFAPGIRISGQRVSVAGAPVGAELPIATAAAYQGFPSMTYSTAAHEYVVAYHSESASGLNIVATRRVKPHTGALLGTSSLQSGVFEQYPEIAYNSRNDQFLAITWHGGGGWMVHGQLANGDALPIGSVLTLATGSGGDGIGLAYNSTSNTYLAVFLSTTNDEIWGANISATGTPGSRFQVTVSGASAAQFSTQPQVAGSTRAARWLASAAFGYKAVMSQLLQHGGGGGGTTLPTPVLSTPSGAGTTNPTFSWSAAAGTAQYQLWVQDSAGNLRTRAWYTSSAVGCAAGGTCRVTPTLNLAPGSYQWWVRGWASPNTYSAWSSPRTFLVGRPSPVALSPSGIVTGSSFQLTWTGIAGATHYYIWLNDYAATRVRQWVLASDVCNGTSCAMTVAPPMLGGNAVWWVQAWNSAAGYSPWSAPRRFALARLGTPQPLTPGGTIGSGAIEFGWTAVSGATDYYIWVNDSSGRPRVKQWLRASDACTVSGICTRTLTPQLSAGTGSWWVQAWSPTLGYGLWSTPLTFVR